MPLFGWSPDQHRLPAPAKRYVEPGAFELLVGSSSDDIRQRSEYWVRGERRAVGGSGAPQNYLRLDDADLAADG